VHTSSTYARQEESFVSQGLKQPGEWKGEKEGRREGERERARERGREGEGRREGGREGGREGRRHFCLPSHTLFPPPSSHTCRMVVL